jgi:hypothetical protein
MRVEYSPLKLKANENKDMMTKEKEWSKDEIT